MAKLVSQPYTDKDRIVTVATPNAKAPTQLIGALGIFLILALVVGAGVVLMGAFRV